MFYLGLVCNKRLYRINIIKTEFTHTLIKYGKVLVKNIHDFLIGTGNRTNMQAKHPYYLHIIHLNKWASGIT